MKLNFPWPIELYRRSVPKQEKFKQLCQFLGSTEGFRCLDLGIDSGAISYMLRRQGGCWKSADVQAEAVERVRGLLGESVFRIEPSWTPFLDREFDRVVVVDLLEHLKDDRAMILELHRVLKSDGVLIINVPHDREGLIRKIGGVLSQTPESHGHLRPGYSVSSLQDLLGTHFNIQRTKTYSKFFSELADLLVRFALDQSLKVATTEHARREPSRMILLAYALAYPFVWVITKLDHLLFFHGGYKLLVEARPRSDGHA